MVADLGVGGFALRGAFEQRERARRVARQMIRPAQRVGDRSVGRVEAAGTFEQTDRGGDIVAVLDLRKAEVIERQRLGRTARDRLFERVARFGPAASLVERAAILQPIAPATAGLAVRRDDAPIPRGGLSGVAGGQEEVGIALPVRRVRARPVDPVLGGGERFAVAVGIGEDVDPFGGRRCGERTFRTDMIEHDERAIDQCVAGQRVGEEDAGAIIAGIGAQRCLGECDRERRGFAEREVAGEVREQARDADRERLPSGRLGDQVAGFGGKAVGDRILRGGGERGAGIAAFGVRDPGVERGCEDHQRPGGKRADRSVGGLRVVGPRGIGEGQERRIGGGDTGLVQHGGSAVGERHVPRLQRLAIGADRNDRIVGRCRQHLGIAGGGEVRPACGVGGAGLQIGGEITGPGRGRRCQDETECEQYWLTCWDNWGLRRPRVRPS